MLTVHHLNKAFRLNNSVETIEVLRDVTFELRQGEVLCVVGESGCGKTTLLRILAGLESITSGNIEWSRDADSSERSFFMVFQDYTRSLFPWLNIRRQLELAFMSQKSDSSIVQLKVDRILELTGLSPYDRLFPSELSGGMQQRVALARALILEPKVLLLDEPFGSLDAQARYALEDHLLGLVRQLGTSVVFVTHDVEEAVYMSDRVLILSSRPASIRGELTVSLPRPRSQRATKATAEFALLRRTLYDRITVDEEAE